MATNIDMQLTGLRQIHERYSRTEADHRRRRQLVGTALREMREAHGLSRTTVAKRARISVAHLAGIERGAYFTPDEASKIASSIDRHRTSSKVSKAA